MVGPGGTWDSIGQSHLSYMVQWDRTDRWDMVGPGGTWDSIGQSHLSYMVQWDRTDRWDVVGPGGTWDSVPPVLHGMVTVVYSGPRYMWIPMDSSPVPWYSGIPTCVQWILMADLDMSASPSLSRF